MKKFSVGDKVRMTGAFLRGTGQIVGGEGLSRWIVQAHPGCRFCVDGEFVLTNERHLFPRSPEELAADPLLAFRHINAHNLELAR